MKWKRWIPSTILIFLALAFPIQNVDAFISRWEDVPGSLMSCGVSYGPPLAYNKAVNEYDRSINAEITLRYREVEVQRFEVSGDIPIGLGGWNIGLLYRRQQTIEWDTSSKVMSIPPRHKVLIFACVLYNVKKKIQRRKYFFPWGRPFSINGVKERKGKLKEAASVPHMSTNIVNLDKTLESILEDMRREEDP